MDAPVKREAEEGQRALWNAVRSVLAAQRDGAPLGPCPRNGALPASFAQQRLWFLAQLAPDSPVHTVTVAHALVGELDVASLERSLSEVIRRHEVLRTTLRYDGGRVLQTIHPPPAPGLPVVDLRGLDAGAREEEAQRRTEEVAHAPFNLESGPLLRVLLLRLAEREHRWVVAVHHAVFDGWSFDVFMGELGALYGTFSTGTASPLPEPALQYADFAVWQRERLQGARLEPLLDYWKRQLGGPLPVLSLPTHHPRNPERARRSGSQSRVLPRELAHALEALSDREGVTLFMTLLAAFQTLLHRYTGEEDIIVGSPVAGRNQAGLSGQLGLFVNTLALRTRLEGKPRFRELLARVRDTVTGAYAHQELPLELLVEAVNPPRQSGHPPLFQVMFAFQNVPRPGWSLPGLSVDSWNVDCGTAAFDLTLFMEEKEQGLNALLVYDADLFDAGMMEDLLGHLRTLLEGIVAEPEGSIATLPLLSPAELHRQLREWNDTTATYPSHSSIHALFEAQVVRTPGAVAVVRGPETLTYRELDQQANQLARHLRSLGVGEEVRVGVCLERSPALVVTLLAILKAGGAYVPVESSAPTAYAARMLRDAGISVLVTEGELAEGLAAPGVTVLRLSAERQRLERKSPEPLGVEVAADALAYVMFTSGSTGGSKGVAVTHRSVVRLVQGADYARLTDQDVFLQLAPVSFDASTFELWGALLNGAKLALGPAGPFSLDAAGEAIRQHAVSILFLTTGLFELFVDLRLEDLAPVRQLLVGGDVLSVPHVRRFQAWARDCRLSNVYGPTENTTFTSHHPLDNEAPPAGEGYSIGRPIANTRVYVLDANLQPVPLGVEGEACMGGDGVARGYLNDPELTRERFVADPFDGRPGARLYRSGDRVRWRRDGRLQFLGRGDGQVKIRGFRIEPGEVEAVLSLCPGVARAAVVAHTERPGDKRLVAYVVPASTAPEGGLAAAMRRFLRARLPEHMLPAAFVAVEALPLTPSGKLDRRALPRTGGTALLTEGSVHAPRDPVERRLLAIFEELLEARPIGVHDNFFDLGGHSLLAVRLTRRLEECFDGGLPLARVVQRPTIAQLADALRQREPPAPRALGPALVELKSGGKGTPFFLVPGGHGGMAEMTLYARVLGRLGVDRPMYGLLARGLDGKTPTHSSVQEMARSYLEDLRTMQPRGPYALGGECIGGAVAFEMAQQLRARGEEVSLLLLLSSWCPSPAAVRHYEWIERPSIILRDRLIVAREAKANLRGALKHHVLTLWRSGGWRKSADVKDSMKALAHATRWWLVALRTYEHPQPGQTAEAERNYVQVLLRYRPRRYAGPVTLLVDEESFEQGLSRDWERWAGGGLRVHRVPGTHESYLRQAENVMLERLSALLAEVPMPETPSMEVSPRRSRERA